ncbi:hypothetical protein MRB53_033756 [Persea americana]|uniref:Uncharacterized protein n=1 Tax=Persea americana TaxID=3435 RepID=A0ACC2KVE2_PERAE|nr:hypothetical protein MRB53_033756 [Persea americana]
MKDTATLDDVCCDEDAARDSSGDGKVRRNGWLAVEWSSGNDGASAGVSGREWLMGFLELRQWGVSLDGWLLDGFQGSGTGVEVVSMGWFQS